MWRGAETEAERGMKQKTLDVPARHATQKLGGVGVRRSRHENNIFTLSPEYQHKKQSRRCVD